MVSFGEMVETLGGYWIRRGDERNERSGMECLLYRIRLFIMKLRYWDFFLAGKLYHIFFLNITNCLN